MSKPKATDYISPRLVAAMDTIDSLVATLAGAVEAENEDEIIAVKELLREADAAFYGLYVAEVLA